MCDSIIYVLVLQLSFDMFQHFENIIYHSSLYIMVVFKRQIMHCGLLYFLIASGNNLSVPAEFVYNRTVIYQYQPNLYITAQ